MSHDFALLLLECTLLSKRWLYMNISHRHHYQPEHTETRPEMLYENNDYDSNANTSWLGNMARLRVSS